MTHGGSGAANEYISGDTRGAHLKLAQRHHKVIAGQFLGHKRIEHEFPNPGVIGQLAVSFTPSAALPVESRIVCAFPDHGWVFPSPVINAVLRLPQGLTTPSVKATYTTTERTLEFTLHSAEVPEKTPVVILVSGVMTPESATPSAQVMVTSYEKLVVRNTVPVSTRGGQILDGPTAFTIPRIVPAELSGSRRWQPFSCWPNCTSDVTLSFVIHGRIPANGAIRVELPADGWEMEDSPKVLLRTDEHHNEALFARWQRDQHALEISVGQRSIRADTNLVLTVKGVKNPSKETAHLANDGDASKTARVTTLVCSGGVIDGPTRIEVARISELRQDDYIVATRAFDEECEKAQTDGILHIDNIPELMNRAGILLSRDLLNAIVVPLYPARTHEQRTKSGDPDSETQSPLLKDNEISREEFLNIFSHVYAPAYKYGQELRLACGRGELDRVRELIRRGCDPNAKDGSGWGALHYAADYGHASSIECILDATADLKAHSGNSATCFALDVNTRDVHGWTPLICAAANGHSEIVQKLISLGADPMLSTKEGRTALHWAAIGGMDATVAVLLSAGVDKEHTDRCGWTALHCATLHGSESCVQALVGSGAKEDAKDRLLYPPMKYNEPLLGGVVV